MAWLSPFPFLVSQFNPLFSLTIACSALCCALRIPSGLSISPFAFILPPRSHSPQLPDFWDRLRLTVTDSSVCGLSVLFWLIVSSTRGSTIRGTFVGAYRVLPTLSTAILLFLDPYHAFFTIHPALSDRHLCLTSGCPSCSRTCCRRLNRSA